MFVAWRDLRSAKGRFALTGSVVLLVTLMVGLLSGLTAGLARENISALTGLPVSHLAFAAPAGDRKVSFTASQVPESAWLAWRARPGVRSAEPLGIRTVDAVSGERTAPVSAFGVDPAGGLAPRGAGLAPGRVVLTQKAARELGGLTAGATLRIGPLELTVSAVAGTAAHSHTPVVWMALDDWQRVGGPGTSASTGTSAPGTSAPGTSASTGPSASAAGGTVATVVAVSGSGMDLAAADRAASTRALTVDESLGAVGSYQAENGSLQLMRGFLFAISALVTGAFFTVWTIQRSGDIAVLKALGASTPYLLRDALGQAVVLLAAGTGLGTALAAGFGALISGGDVPFVLDAATVLVPAAIMIALGVLGAALSIRRITAVDPLTALGSAR
ncbi:ABC transporter permease [Streptomyces sp. NRRL F-4428]|uniref:ABC transporter permease n=1 Tax=Streptomyces sp. NRRL F-4428 TaxID=1609137 RepID=UPI0005ECDBC2|nr:ABC transporter permease [Streptomyces sp. NRRL F-4428]KJK49120.1 ABC transporter substrate-binding protein [Streptomyces sp. NRRL F-4428]